MVKTYRRKAKPNVSIGIKVEKKMLKEEKEERKLKNTVANGEKGK